MKKTLATSEKDQIKKSGSRHLLLSPPGTYSWIKQSLTQSAWLCTICADGPTRLHGAARRRHGHAADSGLASGGCPRFCSIASCL